MSKYKTSEIKLVSKVQVSAIKLRSLADKLEKVFETAENIEIDLYLVEEEGKQTFAFDLVKKVVTDKPEETKDGKETEVKKEDVKPEEKETPTVETSKEEPVVKPEDKVVETPVKKDDEKVVETE